MKLPGSGGRQSEGLIVGISSRCYFSVTSCPCKIRSVFWPYDINVSWIIRLNSRHDT